MYFCYPKQSNRTFASVIAALACQQLLPVKALELSRIVHFIADNSCQNRLNSDSSCIRAGSSVELKNLDTNEQGWLQLVYPGQASYRRQRISVLSPLGSALLGKTAGSDIQLSLLSQPLRLHILSVIYVKQRTIRNH